MGNMRLPNNELPAHMYEDVKICNRTKDVTFTDTFDKFNPNSLGDIVLGPGKYCMRKKYEAMLWFGHWDKTGKEWADEVQRVGKRQGVIINPDNPVFKAIQDHKLYVEGYTEGKDYKSFSLEQYKDKNPQFTLDDESTKYMNQKPNIQYDLVEQAVESADITPIKK